MTEQAVGRRDLQRYLQGKCVSPQTEASTIWTLLVHSIVDERADLICNICGKHSGECQDNTYIDRYTTHRAYYVKQTQHWMIAISSLKKYREALKDREIRLLGSPEKPRPRRKLLYGWIDSLQ